MRKGYKNVQFHFGCLRGTALSSSGVQFPCAGLCAVRPTTRRQATLQASVYMSDHHPGERHQPAHCGCSALAADPPPCALAAARANLLLLFGGGQLLLASSSSRPSHAHHCSVKQQLACVKARVVAKLLPPLLWCTAHSAAQRGAAALCRRVCCAAAAAASRGPKQENLLGLLEVLNQVGHICVVFCL
jgi:hypothetical protein